MYFRYIITMVVTLFSSRWVLLSLGAEDFGIYSLVAGLLSMLMFLNITMASSTQRFLSYSIGVGNEKLIRETFYYSCIIHLVISIIIVVLFETCGLWFMHNVLDIPDGKMDLAEFVLHCLSVSTFFSVMSVPYNAALLAHENIIYISIIQICEAILKFMSAYYLLYYDGTRLKLYAFLMMLIHIFPVVAYRTYCNIYYSESRIQLKKIRNSKLMHDILSYSSWNLIGGISSITRTQGVAMLLNTFYGVLVNAAYGIATQVNGQLGFLSQAVLTAAKPQIVKSEGKGDRRKMLELSKGTSKITFLMLSLVAVPLIIEMPYILKLWLKEVPEYAVSFTRLIIIMNMVRQLSTGISLSIESVGNIRMLQTIVAGMHFLVLPVGYLMLKIGVSPYLIFVMVIVEEIVGLVARVFIANKVTGVGIKELLLQVISPTSISVIITFFVGWVLTINVANDVVELFLVFFICILLLSALSYIFVLNANERQYARSSILKISNKLSWKKNLTI